MIKKAFIQIFLIISSYLIPKNKKLIVLGAGPGNDFKGNPKYFFLYLNQENTKYKAFWSAGNKKVYNKLKESNLPVFYRYSCKGLWKILRAKYFVIEKSSKDVYYTDYIFGRFNFIQTWHGITIKKLGIHAVEEKKGQPGKSILAKEKLRNFMRKFGLLSMMKYKLILSTTTNQDDLLKEVFLNKNVFTLGYPRNDLFFNKNLLVKDLISFLNKKYDKILLYAPTFRDNKDDVNPMSKDFFKELDEYCSINNFLFIIKKHPLQKNLKAPENAKNIIDLSSDFEDIHELLYYADILISDYSSTVNDFILTDKPNVYYCYDYEEYEKSCRGFYYNYFETMSGPFAKNEDELLNIIKNTEIWTKDEEYLKLYNKQKEFFHTFTDGNSSERLVNFLDSDKI